MSYYYCFFQLFVRYKVIIVENILQENLKLWKILLILCIEQPIYSAEGLKVSLNQNKCTASENIQ